MAGGWDQDNTVLRMNMLGSWNSQHKAPCLDADICLSKNVI